MSDKEEELTLQLQFTNKKYPKKPIFCYIKKEVDIYQLKKRLIGFFSRNVKKTVTDFRLVEKDEKIGEDKDTIENNYFDEKYNNDEAFELMKKIQKYYEEKKLKAIYFRTIQLTISTIVIDSKKEKEFKIPLAFENSYDQWFNNIQEELKKKIPEHPFHVFEKNDKYDKISEDADMKQYQKNGLIVYLFPIQTQFVFNSTRKTMLLKFNNPLKNYFEKISKKLNTTLNETDFLFQIQHDNTVSKINLDTPIHDILKKQNEEPVIIEILDISPKKINISIPLQNNEFTTINYEYKSSKLRIQDLIEELKKYFSINDTIKLLTIENKEVDSSKCVSSFQSLILNYNLQNPLKMIRKFTINGQTENKEIIPSEKVNSIIRNIAYEHNSDESLIELKLGKKVLEGSNSFGHYFIPPETSINVVINEFPCKLNLEFKGIQKENIETGFAPNMKLKSLKKSKIFQNDDLKKYQNIFFFFNNEKLDENKSFEQLDIKDNEKIDVYVTKHYLYKLNNKLYPLPSDSKFETIKTQLSKQFKLDLDGYFIDFNGKPASSDKNNFGTRLENGTILELKKPVEMKFKIDKKYDVTIQSTKQVKDVVNQLSKMNDVPFDKIQLFNDVGNQLRSDSYLYSSFIVKEEGHVYSIISKRARSYTFLTSAGKFFNESFLPSTKIAAALEALRKSGKKISEESFITYQGRVIDSNSTFDSIIKDDNEDDNEDPLSIEDEMQDQIKIKLIFQLRKSADETIADCEIDFIQPATALNIRYWASQFSKQNMDNISLISNGEMLNDDEEIDKNTEVTVGLNIQKNNEQAILETTKSLAKKVAEQDNDIFKTQRIDQKAKKVVESSDESELEDFDEEEEEDILKKGNGTYESIPDGPEDEYIFKFKIINGDELPLQLPCDATVMDAKEKIAENQDTDVENITIFLGNQRLADFNKFTNLKIPKEVKVFSIKIVNLQDTLVCTRVKLKKTH